VKVKVTDQNTIAVEHQAPPDRLAKRLRVAVIASLLVNIIGWRAVAAMAKRPLYAPPRPVEITRVIIDKQGHTIEKKITKEQIKKHVALIKKTPVVKIHPVAFNKPQQPKPQNYNRVLTAPDKGPGNGDEPTQAPGGNADLGKAIVQQPDPPAAPTTEVVKTAPVPRPVVTKAPEVKKPDPTPPPVVHNDPPPPVVQPDPPPVNTGPTLDAVPSNEIKPEIPDSLKHGDFKSFVRVKVEIDIDGTATPILRTSSGNAEIDQRVLDALKKWKWKPALENGEPVKSTRLFKFEFLVE
jgi:protein TonB